MPDSSQKSWVTSKEILNKTGISRATLNNYIKIGIIPKPRVERPPDDMSGVKKIGYFPYSVLDRIERVKQLKQDGNSMDEIADRLKNIPIEGVVEDEILSAEGEGKGDFALWEADVEVDNKGLKLTFDELSQPAYLINYHFQVVWANRQAEEEIFCQSIRLIKEKDSRNIFKLFFHWQFHNQIRNWRDLVALRMSFAKIKYTGTWMEKLYRGISRNEAAVLKDIYSRVEPFKVQTITDRIIALLMEDGTTESYRVYSIFFREGIFFLYNSAKSKKAFNNLSSIHSQP